MSENYNRFINYLTEERVFPELKEKLAVFSIVWNNYEADFFNHNYRPYLIEGKIINNIKLSEGEMFKINDLYSKLMDYFSSREINETVDSIWDAYRFESGFDKRNPDFQKNVNELKEKLNILINTDNETNKLHFLLLIAGRVRNNLFHGLKTVNELNENEKLFDIIIETIILLFINKRYL